MSDREFKFKVLELTLNTAAIHGIRDPEEMAQRNLEWCLSPIDKPKAQSVKQQPKTKSG
jgi:hypothetical protein